MLAIYHERSTTTDILRDVGRPPTVSVVTYGDTARAEAQVEAIFDRLAALVEHPVWREDDVNPARFGTFFAESLAGRLAGVLDRVATRPAA